MGDDHVWGLNFSALVRTVPCYMQGLHVSEHAEISTPAVLLDCNPGLMTLSPSSCPLGNPFSTCMSVQARICNGQVLKMCASAMVQVVVRQYPAVPASVLVAAEWVALLAYGALDCHVYQEQAKAIIDLLWAAADHQAPLVWACSKLAVCLCSSQDALWQCSKCKV